MRLIRVALDVPLSTLFDYKIEKNIDIQIGQRVLVPFGRKEWVGVVLEKDCESDLEISRIKPVLQVLTDVPPLPKEILTLLQFCSDYYHYPLGQVVLSALPTRLRAADPLRIKQDKTYQLTALGRVQVDVPKRQVVLTRMMAQLAQGVQSEVALLDISASARKKLNEMLAAGWLEEVELTPARLPHRFENAHALNDEQQRAVEQVAVNEGFQCFLLHGVTGSGKTETYVHLIHQVLQRAQQVLLLIPEINLTPQLEQYFRNRFPATELVSLHSGLSDGARAQNWLHAQTGRARIVLGTRLAVFAPIPELGLILIDEEHDASFKQQDGLRYSARDVAIFRANQRGIPIVLGSATPSLESWQNAQSGRYKLLQLTRRAIAAATLPTLRCLDMRNAVLQEGLSAQLLQAIEQRLKRKEQSLVFINRRGYAPVLMCSACGWLSNCPNCAGKLVLHLEDKRLRCHHCGYQARVPVACPSCGNADLLPVGAGTQRIEAALHQHFPDAAILRVDRDSTRNKGTWDAMRQEIQEGNADILVGTQILAKGHDFPNLTLVGILNADAALYSADFRASERLYAQLAQVAGRAGRAGKAGEVLIQTGFPEHPIYQALRTHDYKGWADTLLAEREMAGFPPYVFQAMLRAEALQSSMVFDFLNQARMLAKSQATTELEIYGVVPASMAKRAQHTRAQLLIQSSSRKILQNFLRNWLPELTPLASPKLRWALDVDPIEF